VKIRLQTAWYSPEHHDLDLDQFPALVGRADHCNITVPAGFISRRHCRFVRNGTEILVQDLNSLNGTFVNGNLANVPTPLRHGDEIQLGPMSFRVVVVENEDAVTYHPGSTPFEMTVC
jgi:pSer/pThr/pTyr-binding forkhead associated (FHA) protein